MTGMKVVPFFLLISLMIFSTHALEAFLTDGIGQYTYESDIYTRKVRKIKYYEGCYNKEPFEAKPDTRTVIVYIRAMTEMHNTILRLGRQGKRMDIAAKLLDHSCQLLYLAIGFFHPTTDKDVVGEFLRDVIMWNSGVSEIFQIVTIGDNTTDLTYGTPPNELKKYDEGEHIIGYDLLKDLKSLDERI